MGSHLKVFLTCFFIVASSKSFMTSFSAPYGIILATSFYITILFINPLQGFEESRNIIVLVAVLRVDSRKTKVEV